MKALILAALLIPVAPVGATGHMDTLNYVRSMFVENNKCKNGDDAACVNVLTLCKQYPTKLDQQSLYGWMWNHYPNADVEGGFNAWRRLRKVFEYCDTKQGDV